MKIQTSTSISPEASKAIEAKMLQAAKDTKSPKFFAENQKLEVITAPNFPSIEEMSKSIKPLADPVLCAIGYAAAKKACNGDAACEAIAYALYQECLDSDS